jgi:GTPase SAR1 family protein
MLPSEPKIFHGREAELADILRLFNEVAPRIAILGAGGMGKTSLARAIIHHTEITAKYEEHRFYVACDSATTKVELAALIGGHLGLKPGRDLTRPVVQYFSSHPPSLLILDNLETLWEPAESRNDIRGGQISLFWTDSRTDFFSDSVADFVQESMNRQNRWNASGGVLLENR